jgi:hypothetical protein
MAFRVELTKSVEADLEALYLWVKGRAPHQGAAWFNRLEQAILSLDQRARQVCRVLFWSEGAPRVAYVLHVRPGAREALRLPIVSSESE